MRYASGCDVNCDRARSYMPGLFLRLHRTCRRPRHGDLYGSACRLSRLSLPRLRNVLLRSPFVDYCSLVAYNCQTLFFACGERRAGDTVLGEAESTRPGDSTTMIDLVLKTKRRCRRQLRTVSRICV